MISLPAAPMLSKVATEYLYHHVFLPPQLPQKDDYDAEIELILLNSVIHALVEFKGHATGKQADILDFAIEMLCRLRDNFGNHGEVTEDKLIENLERFDHQGGFLPIQIRSQNAAVLLSEKKNEIHVEAFELSPRNESVYSTVGRLQRQFPGPTFALDRGTFKDAGLQHTIAQTLSKMSHQSVAGTKPKAKKAGQVHDEERDTTSPSMVTELFITFLRPRCTIASTVQIHKNTREEVLWLDCKMPWRRSPLWLLIRISLQLVIQRLRVQEDVTEDLYKHFMIYYMSTTLKLCHEKIPTEWLYLMTAKIARRLRKLDCTDDPAWFSVVQDALRGANNLVREGWNKIMSRNRFKVERHRLAGLDFAKDVYCSLPDLDLWLEDINRRGHSVPSADFQPQPKLLHYQRTQLPSHLDLTDPDCDIFNLAIFEDWVGSHLEDWLRVHVIMEQTCQQLKTLISCYYTLAEPVYSSNPEAVSIMLLTILELYIACDKSALQIHLLLYDYDLCILTGMFESLLLPHQSQMARLARGEAYMKQRRARVQHHGSGIFRDFGTSSCFAVRYFDQCEELQGLLASIEERARRERAAKLSELEHKKNQYQNLRALAEEMKCTYDEVIVDRHHNMREKRHSGRCQKCSYENQAEMIKIEVHEWPLSSNHLDAKSTVFELNAPRPFAWWRDATVFFLNVLHIDYHVKDQPRAIYQPQSYGGLSSFFTPIEGAGRISLLSQDKPHIGTHRRDKKIINITINDICLDNGLHFQYFDEKVGCYVAEFDTTNENTAISCTYKLPQPSSSLQQFLLRTPTRSNGVPPNMVIASQHACPADMTLEEYRALCSMPYGVRIQWKNLLRQLAMPSVIFKKAETCIFLLQIINQAGPAGNSISRNGHTILNDDRFTTELLEQIRKSASRIEKNWESSQELFALIMLTLRVLTLSNSRHIQDLCLRHLTYTREIAFRWMGIVRDKANSTNEHNHRTELMAQSAQIALVCVSTFDTEPSHLRQIVQQPLEATIYFQCCMMIQDRDNIIDMASNCLLPIMFFRWKALSYRLYRLIATEAILVPELTAALDEAIAQTWAAYRIGSPWTTVSRKADYWLVTRMLCESSKEHGLRVHYNILTGELLINGQPLASLPSQYVRHKTYTSLFGRSFVEVMPSSLPGMQFSVQREHMGNTVHLGKHCIPESDKFDLCVRAVKGDKVWEFVPPRLLAGLFPDAFVENYVHWYNLNGGYLEFRPATEPWTSSDAQWRLQKRCLQRGWCLTKSNTSLVNLKSDTAKLISMIFKPIERAPKLHCKLHLSSSVLEIEIPRLRVGFSLESGQSFIMSRQYPNMMIDADQSLETLVGLRNKLMLIHVNNLNRMVLIPEGDVTWRKDIGHVAVEIGWQAKANIHAYSVDSQLGRLMDNGNLHSKLILSYLHAVTSFCIPDPLTQMTGTEQALSILRSASLRSFVELDMENIITLEKIALLTPRRKFYPAHEKVMQSVQWQENLGCLTQHDDFREQVMQIFMHDRRMGIFRPSTKVNLPSLPDMDAGLLQRSQIRSSTFRLSSFGAEEHTTKHDYLYSSLGREYQSENCRNVFTLCKVLHDEVASEETDAVGTIVSRLWELLSRPEEIHGPGVEISKAKIGYDASYILEPFECLSTYWCGIHQLLCSETYQLNKYQVMMWLSTLAYSNGINMAILRVVAALYINPQMRLHLPPPRPQFHPCQGCEVNETDLRSNIRSAILSETPETYLSPMRTEDYYTFQRRRQNLTEKNRNQVLNIFINGLQLQWPTPSPSIPACRQSPKFHDYFDTQKAIAQAKERFSVWFHNRELKQYLVDIASVTVKQRGQYMEVPSHLFRDSGRLPCSSHGFVSVDDILSESLGPCPALLMEPPRLEGLLQISSLSIPQVPRLDSLLCALHMRKKSNYEKLYVDQLQDSVSSFQRSRKPGVSLRHGDLRNTLQTYLDRCAAHSAAIYEAIYSRMSFRGVSFERTNGRQRTSYKILKTLASGYTWPRLSPNLLLQQLARGRWPQLPEGWKRCFIAYGCSITALQRAKRMLGLVDQHEDLIRELQNPGHSNWNPYDFPESLLLEIENDILIRDVQEQIAQTMRGLRPGQNAVMQLNMGEGKSSVIVPIVAAHHADGSCLVRVLVAKPQSRQMLQMLVSKLGGLLGRRIYHLPISRSLSIDVAEANEIERMCRECMEQGGILLLQPEHILSLKLMCLESFIIGRSKIGESILKTLELFKKSSRDIVDESDENFSVKFELIYTMGTQQSLELSPQRWIIIQEVLSLFRKYSVEIKGDLARFIEVVDHWPGSFPRIRILHDIAAQEILNQIAQRVCQDGMESIPLSRRTEVSRKQMMAYILKPNLSAHEIGAVESEDPYSFWTDSTKDSILLLRGIFAGGILAFCFGQKRWRVNYGHDITRRPPTKLSVPYRAKDNPAPRSEFSHPDVVIVLTCLNYYYSGLSDDELFHTFRHLLRSDQGEAEFQAWVKDIPRISQAYRQLGGINLQDRLHCVSHVFPYFKFSKGAIDYFLCQTVFPREMKEFPHKLSASGWDIGEIKTHPTVGFSGTNDSRATLPLSVKQLDLPEQNHTNALVLEYLLRPENSVTLSPASSNRSRSDAQMLLDMAMNLEPPIQVILDVGAQILELTNLEVAQAWLTRTSENTQKQAVVFVDDHDAICVLDRAGVIEPLQYSPFAQQLGACYVFLDEAHTRGIDLRLPPTYRAAVTLGAGITKDKLVQACMRMRKLGKGQSVVFCIPEEIETKICFLSEKSRESIEVSDVLSWAISETWVEMQRSIPLWAIQGKRFERQSQLWRRYSGHKELTQDQASHFLEDESQSLEQRYRPGQNPTLKLGTNSPKTRNMQRIVERCQEFGDVSISSTQLQEEQERELAPEIEQERQIQRPPPARPKDHDVHPHLRSFLCTGVLSKPSTAFRPAFEVFKHTSVAKYPVLSQFPNQLLVTNDFAETVWMPVKHSYLDHYQRPVDWVLTSRDRSSSRIKHMIVISPHEANELLSEVQKSELVTMHLYAPRQNLSLPALDDLGLYIVSRNLATFKIPRVLKIQLNLFAGQLYASSYDDYLQLCKFLGVSSTKTTSDYEVAADGFILAKGELSMRTFTQSPLKCLKTLMSQIRKDGQEISKTHLGKILDGKLLYPSDFENFGDCGKINNEHDAKLPGKVYVI